MNADSQRYRVTTANGTQPSWATNHGTLPVAMKKAGVLRAKGVTSVIYDRNTGQIAVDEEGHVDWRYENLAVLGENPT